VRREAVSPVAEIKRRLEDAEDDVREARRAPLRNEQDLVSAAHVVSETSLVKGQREPPIRRPAVPPEHAREVGTEDLLGDLAATDALRSSYVGPRRSPRRSVARR
jgi:hypothetical protein